MRAALALIPLMSGLLFAGCIAAGDGDPYSEVAEACMSPVPKLGIYTAARTASYLTPECKAALDPASVERERIWAEEKRVASNDELPHFIPFDEESFKQAPAGFRDKVTEAFQALIAYPLAFPPLNTLLGTSPEFVGALPLDFYEIFGTAPGKNLNQSLFNYVFNKLDVIRYEMNLPGEVAGQYQIKASTRLREMKLSDKFWNNSETDEGSYRVPFIRASILAHEARHGDGYMHVACDSSQTDETGFSCDAELAGPYGFEVAYSQFLLHGSAGCVEEHPGTGCKPPLHPVAVWFIGAHLCVKLQNKIMHLYPELTELLKDVDCKTLTYSEIMAFEGISIPTTFGGAGASMTAGIALRKVTE